MEEFIKIINTGNAEHYSWGDKCDGWHFVKNDGLSVIREKMPPGATEIMHYLEKSRQFFYILSGKASIEVEDKKYILLPSNGIEIPPLIPHRMYNDSDTDVEFIVVSQPKSHGDRVEVRE
jgi:mannose-6-phosphate isomerase-like protein (cupin superfamily)